MRHAKAEWKPGFDIWQFDSPLAEGSEKQVRQAMQHFQERNIGFSGVYCSSLTRAGQTAYHALISLGLMAINKREELGPAEPQEWCRLYDEWKQAQPDPNNVPNLGGPECLALWPELCKREGARVYSAVAEIAKEVGWGQAVVAVSHNPLIRLAQFAATGSCEGPDISYCQAICFVFEGDKFVGCEEHLL